MIQIDQLVRSSRKTIALIVERDGRLIVRAPRRASQSQIDQFIEEKSEWIRAKQADAKKRQSQKAVPQFVSGEAFLFLGERYPLEIINRAGNTLSLSGGCFKLAAQAQPQAKVIFTAWYKAQARRVFNERVSQYARQFKLTYSRVRVSSARTRWGSCSTKGTLSFTWRLVMAPLPVIDYVVIHELAHTLEPNHSARFWKQVAAMMPDYVNYRQWLKTNGYRLTLE